LLGHDALNLFFNTAHGDRFSSGRDFENFGPMFRAGVPGAVLPLWILRTSACDRGQPPVKMM
jgi:hypothetical protein